MCDSVTMSRLQSQLDSSAQRCAFRTQLSIPVRKRDLKDGTSVCSCRYVIFFVIASSFRFVVFVCGRCGCGAMAFLKKKALSRWDQSVEASTGAWTSVFFGTSNCEVFLVKQFISGCTPPKTNMEPKNEGFEDAFPFQMG